jgi:hypothetical protein
MNGVAPLDPVAVIDTSNYADAPSFCAAIIALYNEGYVYTFDVVKGTGE